MRRQTKRTFVSRYGVSALLLALLLIAAGCAQGSVGDQVQVSAVLNGEDLAASAPSNPVAISDDRTAELTLALTNVSNEPVGVRYVRFEGEVIDMIFLTYDTAVSVPLAAGESRTLPPILLDFFDLGGQASGYLRGNVQLYDEDRNALGSQQMFLDASGDGLSTLELFNLLLLAATVLGAGWNLLRLAQRRLPANRLVRALRFLSVGAGAGLTLAVAFSTLRIWPLRTLWWLLFTIAGAIIGYFIGLWLPGSEGDDIDLLDEEDLLEELVLERDGMLVGAGAGAAATGAAGGASRTIADVPGSAKKTIPNIAGDAIGSAKKTVSGAAGAAKRTVGDAAGSAKETVAGTEAHAKKTVSKKTMPKAPGSGAKKTVVGDGAADDVSSKIKETLADDDS